MTALERTAVPLTALRRILSIRALLRRMAAAARAAEASRVRRLGTALSDHLRRDLGIEGDPLL
jgi:hypothetical protein